MGRLRSLTAPARPLRGGIPFQSPSEGGCRGTECCPFFCSICRPQSGRVGNETMPFFPAFFDEKGKVGIPTLLPIAHILPGPSDTSSCQVRSRLDCSRRVWCSNLDKLDGQPVPLHRMDESGGALGEREGHGHQARASAPG